MKLICIEHYRCGDFDKKEYYVVPDTMSEEVAEKSISLAQEKYLEAVALYQNTGKPIPIQTDFRYQDDSLTVKDLKAKYAEYDTQLNEYNKRSKEMSGSFSRSLLEVGIIPLYEYGGPDLFKTEVSWGHRHGKTLDY